jgi:hypothetical protein
VKSLIKEQTMPGIASITLMCVPVVPDVDDNIIHAFQIELDGYLPRDLERDWSAMVCTDSPDWLTVVARLNQRISHATFNHFKKGAIQPEQAEQGGDSSSKWSWTTLIHEAPIGLNNGDAPWNIGVTIKGTVYNALVKAKYGYHSVSVLK